MGEQKKRKKQTLLFKISDYEKLEESHSLSPSEIDEWKNCQLLLFTKFIKKKKFTGNKDLESNGSSKFLEGDSNTNFFSSLPRSG